MRLAEAYAETVAAFQALTFDGSPLRVATDENLVNPPCLYLPIPALEFRFDKGRADATWTGFLIAPNGGQGSSGFNLSGMVDAVAGLFPFIAADEYVLNLAGGGTPTRSYRITWASVIKIGA
jgi:hypothetical protein